MSKNYRLKNRIGGQFAPRLIEMLESPAFRVLSRAARQVLARIEIELAHHGGMDNGKLIVTFEQFVEYGVHRHAIAPAIRELEVLGFIEVTEHGRAGNADFRRPSKFRITYRHVNRAEPTHEWRRITEDDAKMIAKGARRQGGNSAGKLPPKKQKSSDGKRTTTRCGKRTTNPEFHGAETITTSHGAETVTTFDTLGGVVVGEAAASQSEAQPADTPPMAMAAMSEVCLPSAAGPPLRLHDAGRTAPKSPTWPRPVASLSPRAQAQPPATRAGSPIRGGGQ
jgi:hypothetical protein